MAQEAKKGAVRKSGDNLTAFDRDLIKAAISKTIVSFWFDTELQQEPDMRCVILQVDRYFLKVKHERVGGENDRGVLWVAKNCLVGVQTGV